MNPSTGNTQAVVTRFASSSVIRFLIAAAVVALLMSAAHGVLAESEADVAQQEMEADYFPQAYAFRAADYDDAFDGVVLMYAVPGASLESW